jgi:hypothetical protein
MVDNSPTISLKHPGFRDCPGFWTTGSRWGSDMLGRREGLPELLSHVDTAAHVGRKPVYRCRVSQTRHFDDACGARPGLPAERYGTLDGYDDERTRETPQPS